MGLRERKKAQTRAEIIETAVALFCARGFDQTRVADIVDPLHLSEATFFNYFATKEAVLAAWIHDLVDAAFSVAGAREAAVRSAGRAAARTLASSLAESEPLLRANWQRLRLAAPAGAGGTRSLVDRGQSGGDLRTDVPPAELAALLTSAAIGALATWAADAESGSEDLAPRLQRAVDLVLDGGRKRNERVRPPARGARRAPGAGVEAREP